MAVSISSEMFPGRLVGAKSQTTFYLESGPLDGQAVLFIHGFGGTARNFTLNMGPLGAAGFRVIVPELWGMGRSAKPRGRYSLDRWVEQLSDLLDQLGIQQTVVVGHSMGGAVAVRLARRHPERVSKLVLVAPLGFGARRKVRFIRLAVLPGVAPVLMRFRRFRVPTREEMLQRARQRFGGRISEEGALAWAESGVLTFGERGFVQGLVRAGRACLRLIEGTDLRVRKDYAELTLPTLVIWGDEDRTVPTQDSQTLWLLRTDARLEIYKECGHHPYLEATEQFNQMVQAFLQDA
jgi:4,5:9,10-diseco-3-hydroxy-5,9,17-trioxoandrosta-1(10),2-diene-4-oate hydrolase